MRRNGGPRSLENLVVRLGLLARELQQLDDHLRGLELRRHRLVASIAHTHATVEAIFGNGDTLGAVGVAEGVATVSDAKQTERRKISTQIKWIRIDRNSQIESIG